MTNLEYICIGLMILIPIAISVFILNRKVSNRNTNVVYQPLTVDEMNNDITLINNALYKIFTNTLYTYLNMDIQCINPKTGENIQQHINKHDYRRLVETLYLGDSYIDKSGKEALSLKEAFINSVFIHYVSETSDNIKNLLYKYYSGYSVSNYYSKNKKPSATDYITRYTVGRIGKMYIETLIVDKEIFNDSKNEVGDSTSETYIKRLQKWNERMFQKTCLDIYSVCEVDDFRDSSPNLKPNNKEGSVK